MHIYKLLLLVASGLVNIHNLGMLMAVNGFVSELICLFWVFYFCPAKHRYVEHEYLNLIGILVAIIGLSFLSNYRSRLGKSLRSQTSLDQIKGFPFYICEWEQIPSLWKKQCTVKIWCYLSNRYIIVKFLHPCDKFVDH